MLTRDEFVLLQEQLALALSVGDAKNKISVYFDVESSRILSVLPTNLSSNDEYASYVIDFCMRSRWIKNPSLMERLLVKLLAQGVSAGTAELTAVLQRVKLGQDPNDHYFNTYWVLNEQPFLNRQSLRPLLKDFIQSSSRSLLQISGPGAGRTYTGELLDYLASEIEDLHFVSVTLNKKDGPSYSVESFAEDLLTPMGIGVPQSSSSSDAASLCRLILRSTKQQSGLWIFVLDGFGQADLQPQLKELLQLLAEKSTNVEYRRKMRLVFVDYSEPFQGVLPAAIASEEIPLPSVDAQNLVDCLTQLNQLRLARGLPLLEQLPTIAAGIMAAAPAHADPRTMEKMRLRYLYDQLRAVAKIKGK
jgi:hypothetical protein